MAAGLKRVTGGWIDPSIDVSLGYEALLAAPIGISAAFPDGSYLFANDAMVELMGHPAERMFERGWLDLLFPDPEERRVTLRRGDEIARSAETNRSYRQVERADGSLRMLDFTSRGFALPDGRRAIMTTAADVTDAPIPIARRPDVGGLDAPDVLFRIDVRSRQVLYVSRSVERMTGFSAEEAHRNPTIIWSQIQPEYVERYREAMSATVRTATAQSLVFAIKRRDGAVIVVHAVFSPVCDGAGRVVVIEGVARDVTAVRAMEKQLEATIDELRGRNEELASLDKLKSQLLANVSHELRTPLVTVKGYTELLLREGLGPITPRQRRGLEIAASNAERLVDLIETLLDFARREEGRLSLRRRRLDLRVPVREAVAQLAERISARGIRLTVDPGPEPLEVDGDHGRLVQLVKALVSNAEKFCDGQGVIRVVTRWETPSERATPAEPSAAEPVNERLQAAGQRRARDFAGGHVVLEVFDTGIGIPQAARAKIFDRFYQVDSSTTRRFGGAGLGLALAKEIVLLHGGDISVDSVEGLGSTFAVRLPPSRSEGDARGRDEQPVVLVGAPEAAFPSLKAHLEAAGYAALHATGGADVARRARRYRPDAVVLALPAVEEALDGLPQEAEDRLPLVVVCEPARRASLPPRVDLVVEPDNPAALVAALRRLLDGGAPPADARRPRVVIVDDEPSTLDFTRFVLEREGFEVLPVVSGEEALQRVDERTDLVVLDLAMEGLDGIEVCRRLKGALATRRVPVLIVTAMTGEEIRRDSLAAGADGFLVKPFALADFLRQVRLHLRADGRDAPPSRAENA